MGAGQQVSRQSVSVWTVVCCSWTSAREQKKKKVTQTTTRFTVDQGEINTTKKILMVWTVLAQFEYSQQCDRHAKYLSNRVKPNAEQLFRCGAEVEKHKPLSLV